MSRTNRKCNKNVSFRLFLSGYHGSIFSVLRDGPRSNKYMQIIFKLIHYQMLAIHYIYFSKTVSWCIYNLCPCPTTVWRTSAIPNITEIEIEVCFIARKVKSGYFSQKITNYVRTFGQDEHKRFSFLPSPFLL